MASAPLFHDLSACRVALVMNEGSGKRAARDRADDIRARMAPRVAEFSVHMGKGSAIPGTVRRALEDRPDVLLAYGGDGTQSAVAGALAGSGVMMGVLPGGTFNYFARELGVDASLDAALDTVLAGFTRGIDVGEVNGRVFLNNASFGVYPEILERREAVYRRWGRSRIAAYWSVFLALRDMRRPLHLTLTVDGASIDVYTPLAFAARSEFQLAHLGLAGAEAVRDGHIALFLAKGLKPAELLAAALRLAFGRMSHGEDFDLLIADEILIESAQKSKLVAFDGEKERMQGPFRLSVRREALRVFVPAPEAQRPATGPGSGGA